MKLNLYYNNLNNFMLINGRVQKVVHAGKTNYLVQVETYVRLAQQSFTDRIDKHLITVEKLTFEPKSVYEPNTVQNMKSKKLVGVLRDIQSWKNIDPNFSCFPIFVPVDHPKYLTSRAVFTGTSGLNTANSILSGISKIELATAIIHYFVHSFTPTITIELQAIIPGKESEIWNTRKIAEIQDTMDRYEDFRPPLFYTWAGIVFKLWTVLVDDDDNSHVIYKEITSHAKISASTSVPPAD